MTRFLMNCTEKKTVDRDSFKDHPQSIGELKSDRTDDCKDWTPRDVLIHVLRGIDKGEINTSVLLVAWTESTEGRHSKGHFRVSSSDALVTMGLLQTTMFKMQE